MKSNFNNSYEKEGSPMSTHAVLGVKYSDNSIDGCYVHFDGHTMTSRIIDFLRKKTTTTLAVLIAEAQGRGGIRSFHTSDWDAPLTTSETTDLLDDDEPYIIDENNWQDNHLGARHWYLVDYETGKIEEKSYDDMFPQVFCDDPEVSI